MDLEQTKQQTPSEEDILLQELRALAGMDAPVQTPASIQLPTQAAADESAKKQGDTKKLGLHLKPTNEAPAAQTPEAKPAQSAQERALPQPQRGIPGWVTGLLILLISAAILALTVVGVWRGLQ